MPEYSISSGAHWGWETSGAGSGPLAASASQWGASRNAAPTRTGPAQLKRELHSSSKEEEAERSR